jgi:hypothetical protein
MRILEKFVRGKRADQSLCEDAVVTTPDFAVVLDGATDVSGAQFDGLPGGLFAARTLAAAVLDLPRDADARSAVTFLTGRLQDALAACSATGTPTYRPSAVMVVYSDARREVWRVGDATYAVDGQASYAHKPVDTLTSTWRQAWTEALLLSGADPVDILADDPGFAAMWPLVEMQERFANTPGSRFSFGVLNGTPVPDEFIQVIAVPNAQEVVLTSDGYAQAAATLAEAEAHHERALAADPMSLAVGAMNRGLRPAWEACDDRAYVRLAI